MRGYAAIGLDCPKYATNVGGVLRAAGCYDAAFVALTGRRFQRVPTDTRKQWRTMPILQVDDLRSVVPYDCVPVAVDLIPGAGSLVDYEHPERAFYVFGGEDRTLGERVTGWCRETIMVPTEGCMNLAAAVNVVLYDRRAKQLRASVKPSLRLVANGCGENEDGDVPGGRVF